MRAIQRNDLSLNNNSVLYWMNRDMRFHDNYAFLKALEIANANKSSLYVFYNLIPNYLSGGYRQWYFKVKSLQELAQQAIKYNIHFVIGYKDNGIQELKEFIKEKEIGNIITDFSPLKNSRSWIAELESDLNIPFVEVDAHNIIPVWETSPKREYAAYTIRPKIHKKLDNYLEAFPAIDRFQWNENVVEVNDFEAILNLDGIDMSCKKVDTFLPGEEAAFKTLDYFIKNKLSTYAEKRNDPNFDGLSNLSPYFHYGILSVQRAVLEVQKADVSQDNIDMFIEEGVIRRELSDNFCYYDKNYDNVNGFADWAKKTQAEHREDIREYDYSLSEFEEAKTHDRLWNAAQMEMVKTGKMHGYMRMYWAKKILEWTFNIEKAMEVAIYLNDKYQLDGRDPNGYTGVAWSIGGVHDRAWPERDVYGKIRYMNFNGCKRKFDVESYISKHLDDDNRLF